MNLQATILRRTLIFYRPARTSRGVYHQRLARYVWLRDADDPAKSGLGECSPLPDLSCDFSPDYDRLLGEHLRQLTQTGQLDRDRLRPYPSMLMGLETAWRQWQRSGQPGGGWPLWDSPFSRGEQGLAVNGLIWMGGPDFMRDQIEAKLAQGFSCLKLKIGALNFEEELAILARLRRRFPDNDLTLRVDANGAFTPGEALEKLGRLADLRIHSIEQPLRAGQAAEMAALIEKTPLPIALDEELIGIHDLAAKKKLLENLRPQFLVLKPTLHGGFSGAEEWLTLAGSLGIDWWATSALESNLGLNAIAQWCATLADEKPQGLGTGGLYANNLTLPLALREERLWLDPAGSWPDGSSLAADIS
ncbi:MAG: o-succinylbenzoate synthase [Candidatus Adiutrix sp.]|jgi:o-succinylbenzoate synthase|nr:o-succinylbenzoate synthase [Candidatus Adiutrix sp.]